jgi:hypothetical protein
MRGILTRITHASLKAPPRHGNVTGKFKEHRVASGGVGSAATRGAQGSK